MPFTFTHRNPEMQLEKRHTALVSAHLRNEFLIETGSYYHMIADKLKELNVFDNIEELLKCAKENNFFVIHSRQLLLSHRSTAGCSGRYDCRLSREAS